MLRHSIYAYTCRIFYQRCQCSLFAWISDVPFQRGRAGDAPGASLGRDAFACASPAAFLRLPVPGNGRAPGGRGPYTGLCGGLPKACRCGALSPARPGRSCKVLPFGSLASPAPVVVRTYWCCRCHLGRVWVVWYCKYTIFKMRLSSIYAIIFITIFYLVVGNGNGEC